MRRVALALPFTLDGKTYLSAGSSAGCKTVITGLPLLTLVGVRVCLTNMHETGAWSDQDLCRVPRSASKTERTPP
jgi:hypothetical protein